MINPENVQKFKSYGFVLTPVIKSKNPNEDKKPVSKNGTWHKDWNDQELLDASRIGAYHRDSKIFDVDFGDKEYNACLLYTSPSPRDGLLSRMPSSA